MMRRITILAVFALCFSCCFGRETEVFRDKNVVAFEKTWPFYPILGLHTGKSIGLKVAGRTYYKVRGMKPYYIDLPQIHSILFVTEGDSYRFTYHIVNLETKKDVEIDGDGTIFGNHLGAGTAEADRVDRVDANTVTLVAYGGDWKEIITLNLQALKVERVHDFDYDRKTGTTGRERTRS